VTETPAARRDGHPPASTTHRLSHPLPAPALPVDRGRKVGTCLALSSYLVSIDASIKQALAYVLIDRMTRSCVDTDH